MTRSDGDIRTASSDGTIFVEGNQIFLVPFEVDRFEIPSGWEVLVADGQEVVEGIRLMSDMSSSQEILAQRDGKVYLTEEYILVRPMQEGYVTVSDKYPLGADNLGRLLSQFMARVYRYWWLWLATGKSFSGYGLISSYLAYLDNTMMRFVDIMYGFPALIILLMAFSLRILAAARLKRDRSWLDCRD
jgi:hypothetical protein